MVGEVLGVALVADAYVFVGEDVVGAVAVGGFVDPEGLVFLCAGVRLDAGPDVDPGAGEVGVVVVAAGV